MKSLQRFKRGMLILGILLLNVVGYGSDLYAKDSYFKGKTIQVLIPASPGGGMDLYVRIIGRYLAKTFDGNFIAVNTPGSGGILATNKFARVAPDGLTLCSVNLPGLMFAQMLGEVAVRFKLEEFNYIGRPESEPSLLFVGTKSGIKSAHDISGGKREFTVGFSGLASDDYYFSKLLVDLIGAKMKPIAGFDGASEVNLAVIKGDIDGGQASWSTMRPLVQAGEVVPIVQLGRTKIPGLENVQTIKEVAPADKKDLVDKMLDLKELGSRTWAAPKGIPADRLKELRDAFDKVMHDPDFLNEMNRAKRLIIPLRGEEIQRMVKNVIASSELKTLVQQFKK